MSTLISPTTYVSSENSSGVNTALSLGVKFLGDELVIDDSALRKNLLILGQAGSGKTTLSHKLLQQQTLRGGGCLYLDAYPSQEQRDFFMGLAKNAGRMNDYYESKLNNEAIIDLKDILSNNKICYIEIDECDKNAFSKKIISDLQQSLEMMQHQSGQRSSIPFMLVMDDIPIELESDELFECCRKSNISLIAAFQSLQSFAKLSPKEGINAINNFHTKVILPMQPNSAQFLDAVYGLPSQGNGFNQIRISDLENLRIGNGIAVTGTSAHFFSFEIPSTRKLLVA